MAKGTVSQKVRANGMTWVYRYQTTRASDGRRVENTKTIGLVKDIGSSATDAWCEVGRQGLDINANQGSGLRLRFRDLAEHYREHELKKRSGIGVKAGQTSHTLELLLDRWILPRWGDRSATEMQPLEIEDWFDSLNSPREEGHKPLSWPSITKIKSVMAQIFRHAQRHAFIPASIDKKGRPSNPVTLARCETGSDYEAIVVSPEQMIVILNELDTPDTRMEWTLALLHAATGLRAEEAFGLKWEDIEWNKDQIHIRRGWSKGKETAGKTRASMTQVAMHPSLARALTDWRRESLYSRDTDWVFASTKAKGKKPRSANEAGKKYLKPAAVKAGVIPAGYKGRFGWHNLRHSLGTFFGDNNINFPMIQTALRQTNPGTTRKYIHRVNSGQIAAQGQFLAAIKVAEAVAS